jgi:MFS family permease
VGSFDSLRHRNFRLLWTGAILSNVGTWMQSVALSWFVFELTRSAFWVSFITFVNFLPIVLSPIGGVLTDRLDRRRILLVTQTLMMVDASLLALLAWTGHASLLAVNVLTLGQGLAFAFNGPSWLAFVPSLVPPEDLINAIALNSTQFSMARVVGPAAAGALISVIGPAAIFAVNAVSYVAVLIALVLISTPPPVRGPKRRARDLLSGGIAYTMRNRRIRTMILGIAVVSFFGAPVTSLLPIYAAGAFHRGAGAFGALAAAMGLGSVFGALAVGRLGSRVSPRAVAASTLLLAGVLVLFAATRVYAVGISLMALYGGCYLFVVAATNGDIQLHVEDSVRGRVLSIYMMAFGALFPLGSLLAGLVAERWGAPLTTVMGAVVCALWGLAMLLRESRGPATEPIPEPG